MKDQLPNRLLTVPYDPAEIILIGRHITASDSSKTASLKIEVDGSEHSQLTLTLTNTGDDHKIALVQSYIFEGNRYELPKPKLMVVTGAGTEIPTDIAPASSKLQFWRMNKSDRTSEFSVEDGTLEALVLEANMPGQRAKGSYAANMQMAHKSGRLTS